MNNEETLYDSQIFESSTISHLPNGTSLQGGKYKIIKKLGQGGFGITYLAIQSGLERKVAIKEFFVKESCIRESSTTVVAAQKPLINHLKQKFIDEARGIARMEHENIVKVQNLFEENGTAYYVMDYIEGESVQDLLKRRGSLPEKEAVAIIMKVASALDYMHKQNRFHLDVKPANIMLRKDGKVILIDFGSSKQYAEVDGENTTTLAPCYTPGYAPLEQMGNAVVKFLPSTDIYALGATMYKMLTGMNPPSAIDIVNGEEKLSSLPDDISRNVKECVAKAMIPQRNQRLQSVGEFVKRLTIEDYDGKKKNVIKTALNYGARVVVVLAAIGLLFLAPYVGDVLEQVVNNIVGVDSNTPQQTISIIQKVCGIISFAVVVLIGGGLAGYIMGMIEDHK